MEETGQYYNHYNECTAEPTAEWVYITFWGNMLKPPMLPTTSYAIGLPQVRLKNCIKITCTDSDILTNGV